MTRSSRSKTMKNFNRTADRTLNRVGNVTVKGIEKTAKWMATDHTGAVARSSLMGLSQSVNFGIAELALINRRMQRNLDSTNKFIKTGIETTFLEHAFAWVVDYLHYVLDLIWGFVEPIVFNILFTIYNIFLILLFNAIFFFALYVLITS